MNTATQTSTTKWYTIEIPYNTRTMIDRATAFANWLDKNGYKQERGIKGTVLELKVLTTAEKAHDIERAIGTLVYWDSLKEA